MSSAYVDAPSVPPLGSRWYLMGAFATVREISHGITGWRVSVVTTAGFGGKTVVREYALGTFRRNAIRLDD